jgi:hypothetical protein
MSVVATEKRGTAKLDRVVVPPIRIGNNQGNQVDTRLFHGEYRRCRCRKFSYGQFDDNCRVFRRQAGALCSVLAGWAENIGIRIHEDSSITENRN